MVFGFWFWGLLRKWSGGFCVCARLVGFARVFAGIRDLPLLSLASAIRYRASRVAPVRGGTYFSLPPRNYSAVTRGETTNPAKPNASAL
ncbi:hypothetical protein, partial [Paraburkholderia caribensis]|uniref:hypothetical protein n=1 Tax=Paraburkholderia caribensis TaxID=75105 RepID=UPI003F4972D7